MAMHKYCRVSKNETERQSIGQFIRRFFIDSYRYFPSELVLVTWDRVGYYNNGTEKVSI